MNKQNRIKVGKLGTFTFKKGYYVYIGSAPSDARIRRHLRKDKKKHWHIDYLLDHGTIVNIYVSNIPECKLAERLNGKVVVKKFGSTDCKCDSHLKYFETNPKKLLSKLGKEWTR